VPGRSGRIWGEASAARARFGGPEVLDIVDVPEPEPGAGQQLYDVSTAGINSADTQQALSRGLPHRG